MSSDDPDDVPLTDSIIARAWWWSLLVVAVLGVAAAGVVLFVRRAPPAAPSPSGAPIALPGPPQLQAPSAPHFTDVAQSSGVCFTHTTGAQGDKLLPETMGGGVALTDLDSDGDADIVLIDGCEFDGPAFSAPPKGRGPVQVFQNLGNMKFVAVPEAVAADSPMYGMGVAAADYDGDGRVDLFVTGVGEDRLYRNVSEGGLIRLHEATAESGIAGDGAWSTSAGFFDADRDGDLDLLVARYVRWSPAIDRVVDFRLDGVGRAYGPPTGFGGSQLSYWLNNGGVFHESTAESGFTVSNGSSGEPVGKALGLLFEDPDRDGDLDVFVANDTVPKFVFENTGSGIFREVGTTSGFAFDRNGAATGAMGIDAATLHQSDDLAIAVGNFANEPSSLYVSRGLNIRFSDDATVAGLAAATRPVLTFGLLFLDADLDGDLDLYQANGHIESEINRVQSSQSYEQPGQLFLNQTEQMEAASKGESSQLLSSSSPLFVQATPDKVGDLALPAVGRGAASADLDHDGDVDIVRTQVGGSVAVLRNDVLPDQSRHWLRVRLIGKAPNTGAIGSRIDLIACGKSQRRLVSGTRSYLSQVELAVNFGLGSCDQVETLTITWPSGSIEVVPVEGIDSEIVVSER
ncbi:MAG: CRTAC1 family protein [Phycisphaerales bacterium]|nr:CRTAC1 family protein [Phycisphaerales bacterium]